LHKFVSIKLTREICVKLIVVHMRIKINYKIIVHCYENLV
jgi:hypothetical protein